MLIEIEKKDFDLICNLIDEYGDAALDYNKLTALQTRLKEIKKKYKQTKIKEQSELIDETERLLVELNNENIELLSILDIQKKELKRLMDD